MATDSHGLTQTIFVKLWTVIFINLFVWVCVGLWLIPILIFNLSNAVLENRHVEVDQEAGFGFG
jgi:hypothetical protein